MGRLRSFVRRAVKPAAMVGVVGLLSLGLVVSTPSNAQALVSYPKIPPAATFIVGATKTVAPVAMAAASFTPVGLGLRLAFLAFSTADLWLPLVTGAFGEAPKDKPAESFYNVLPTFRLGTLSQNNARQLALTWTYAGTHSTNKTVYMSTNFNCRQIDNSSNVHPIGTVFNHVQNTAISMGVNNTTKSGTLNSNMCPVGSEIVNGTVGGQPTYPGPENVLTWGSVGGFDPRGANVGYQGRSECIDAQGTVSWVDGPVTPGDNDGGTMLMPSCEKAGKGHGTGRTQVKGFKPDGTTETVWDTGANPLMDPATPLCDPGRTSSGCLMEVTKDGQPCKSGDVECENWASESKKEGNTRYGCKLGPYMLPASACSLLEQAYMPGGSPLNDQNTDGDPATRSNAGPNGQPAPAPAPAVTNTGTGTGTGTNPVPGGSGQTGPAADTGAKQCFPAGWAMFNPVEWVLKPIRCAFEPTRDVQQVATAIATKAEGKAPISFLNLEMVGPSGSGCPNWVISVPGFSQNVVCGSSFTAAILSIRAPLFGIIAAAMVWPLLRSLWYAAIPILRVTPSSGGK